MSCSTSTNISCAQTLFFEAEQKPSDESVSLVTRPPETIDFSVVLPVCNEAANLPELIRRLQHVLEKMSPRYELIFVDDGSRDQSPAILEQYASADKR